MLLELNSSIPVALVPQVHVRKIQNQVQKKFEREFGAETLGIGSTSEGYKTCEYELLTPSELGDRALYIFSKLSFVCFLKIQNFCQHMTISSELTKLDKFFSSCACYRHLLRNPKMLSIILAAGKPSIIDPIPSETGEENPYPPKILGDTDFTIIPP